MRGPSQFQQFITLPSSFPGEAVREKSPTFPLRDSRAGQRLPRGPLWPLTGSPQEVQQAWRRITDEEEGVVAIGAVAGRVDIIGVEEMADTTVAVASEEAAGTVAGVGATEAEAWVVNAAETEAGYVTTGTVAVVKEITGVVEEIGVEETGVTDC